MTQAIVDRIAIGRAAPETEALTEATGHLVVEGEAAKAGRSGSGPRIANPDRASGSDMPARTAEERLSTASGQTSANSRCRRRARPA